MRASVRSGVMASARSAAQRASSNSPEPEQHPCASVLQDRHGFAPTAVASGRLELLRDVIEASEHGQAGHLVLADAEVCRAPRRQGDRVQLPQRRIVVPALQVLHQLSETGPRFPLAILDLGQRDVALVPHEVLELGVMLDEVTGERRQLVLAVQVVEQQVQLVGRLRVVAEQPQHGAEPQPRGQVGWSCASERSSAARACTSASFPAFASSCSTASQ